MRSIKVVTVCIKGGKKYVGTKSNKLRCLYTEHQIFVKSQLDKFEDCMIPTNIIQKLKYTHTEKKVTSTEKKAEVLTKAFGDIIH